MKILHIYKTFFPDTFGGVEELIEQLCLGCQEHKIISTVVSLTRKPNMIISTEKGYTSYRIPQNFQVASTPFSLKLVSTFRELAKDSDLIHYHFPWPFQDIVYFLNKIRGVHKPSIITYHSDIVNQKNLYRLYSPLMHRFLSNMDKIICTSSNYLGTSPVLKKHAPKVEIIPIGINEQNHLMPSPQKLAYWRQRVPQPFFLFVGVLRYYKGLSFLIKAAANIEIPIVIVGDAQPYRQELEQLAHNLNLKNVHFLGALPNEDKNALLHLCHALVLPSHLRSEAFGISLVEGAMAGKPLISCEIGTGTTFINIHKETGLVVEPQNPQALSEALTYLAQNPKEASEMGKRARKRYETHFTASQMCQAYTDVYRQILSAPR